MKALAAIAVVLLALIAGMLWQHQAAEDAAQAEHAKASAAYLDCMAHAKYTDLCMVPDHLK